MSRIYHGNRINLNLLKETEFQTFNINIKNKIPGVGYFYGGITSKKNMLTMLMAPSLSIAINSIQVIIL
jgi:hypothetical protein